jgi:hypothetical protein
MVAIRSRPSCFNLSKVSSSKAISLRTRVPLLAAKGGWPVRAIANPVASGLPPDRRRYQMLKAMKKGRRGAVFARGTLVHYDFAPELNNLRITEKISGPIRPMLPTWPRDAVVGGRRRSVQSVKYA